MTLASTGRNARLSTYNRGNSCSCLTMSTCLLNETNNIATGFWSLTVQALSAVVHSNVSRSVDAFRRMFRHRIAHTADFSIDTVHNEKQN